MLNVEEWMDIRGLHREGHSIKQLAAMTGRSRNTIRKTLREKVPQQIITRKRTSKIEAFREYLRAGARARQFGLPFLSCGVPWTNTTLDDQFQAFEFQRRSKIVEHQSLMIGRDLCPFAVPMIKGVRTHNDDGRPITYAAFHLQSDNLSVITIFGSEATGALDLEAAAASHPLFVQTGEHHCPPKMKRGFR
ncbi:MAG: hypothetical protein ABI837_02120 [Acidobacteriota bacterium]